MQHAEKWIWLDPVKYPESQTTMYSTFLGKDIGHFTVADFKRKYVFDSKVVEAELRFSGDTAFQLYLNDTFLANGPVDAGGDFSLYSELPQPHHYASEITLHPNTDVLDFKARIRMMPVTGNEYSRGHGSFMLWGKLRLQDGRVRYITTDATWLCKKNHAHMTETTYVQALDVDAYVPAVEVPNIWQSVTAPLKIRTEKNVYPLNNRCIVLAPGEKKELDLEFDKIYSAYVCVKVQTQGTLSVKLDCIETDTPHGSYQLRFYKEDVYRGIRMHGIGAYHITAENQGTEEAIIEPYLIATSYPIHVDAHTYTSDADLNLILEVCKHTLDCCRQTIHLDSPVHCEPLGCSGDYYVETMMTAMSFGDMSLAEMDIRRVAEMLRARDGRMFHTTYTLIWVKWMWDVYSFTGDIKLLKDCQEALSILLQRFETYIGDTGLLENPPDYMFIDWIFLKEDGITMHHPPKAVGQTCLCAYYYGALNYASKIYTVLGETAESQYCNCKAEALKKAMNLYLYDPDRKYYCAGLTTPTPEHLIGKYMPQNVDKIFYLPHANVLCALFCVCDDDTARTLIHKIMTNGGIEMIQPYFMHFVLEAVDRLGLREEYTLKILEKWKAPVKECSKGLVEGFIKPEPTYSFDHSHAWGGTPLYSLPKALLGLKIIEPGYKKIRIQPQLLGLEAAHVEVPTPYGMMKYDLKAGEEVQMEIPRGIEIVE